MVDDCLIFVSFPRFMQLPQLVPGHWGSQDNPFREGPLGFLFRSKPWGGDSSGLKFLIWTASPRSVEIVCSRSRCLEQEGLHPVDLGLGTQTRAMCVHSCFIALLC